MDSGGVDFNAKIYAKEFKYTTKHLTHYYNDLYSILLYKDIACIDELSIKMAKIDFGVCYTKVKEKIDPPTDDNIIVALVEKFNGDKKSTNTYSFYHPKTGEKIDADTICKDEEIVIKESVLSQLNNTGVNLDSILYLTHQDINIFNLSDDFYTDICYHFDSPNGKDVPLQDRIKKYYPNITLCNIGCTSKGVNLTTMESICECKFNNLMNNELIEGNAFIQNTFGEVTELLNSSNLVVLQCCEDVFKIKYILKGTGGFIILSIIFLEIVSGIVFILFDMAVIRKYLFNLTEYFFAYISNINKNSVNLNLLKASKKTKTPPKKKENKNEKNLKKEKLQTIINSKLNKNISIEDNQCLTSFKSDTYRKFNRIDIFKKNNKIVFKKGNAIQTFQRSESISLTKLKKAKNLCDGIDMEEYLKQSLDELEYDDAIKLDKRDFCEYLVEKLSWF